MTEKELKKLSLLAEVACDYYERGLDQSEIADRLYLSRTRVSRLLKEAMEKGIVKITIDYSYEKYNRHYELEERFLSRFPLKNVLILNNRNRDLRFLQRDVANLAATYVMDHLKKNMVIGTAWGTTLADMLKFLYPADMPIDIVQLMGAVPCKTPNCTPQSIVAGMADRLQGHADFLNMPLYIEDDYVREKICKDSNNAVILNKGMFSDMIITSVIDVERVGEKDIWLGYMTPELYGELIQKGAVGSMFAHFYDKEGIEIECTWNQKCVSIPIKYIKSVPDVVVVASSPLKAQAILSAIKGNLIDTLVTDGTTATAVLNLLQ